MSTPQNTTETMEHVVSFTEETLTRERVADRHRVAARARTARALRARRLADVAARRAERLAVRADAAALAVAPAGAVLS